MNIFQISYKTLYNWFNRWELEGMIGLYNKQEEVLSHYLTLRRKPKLKKGLNKSQGN